MSDISGKEVLWCGAAVQLTFRIGFERRVREMAWERENASVRAKPHDPARCKPPNSPRPDERKIPCRATGWSAGRLPQRLIDVHDDIAHVLDPDGETDIILRHTGRLLLCPRELLVRGGGRMDDEALGVADVGQV